MSEGTDSTYARYFSNRGVSAADYEGYELPGYLRPILPRSLDARILDIGCGFGQMLDGLRRLGYRSLRGVDLSPEAIEASRGRGLDAAQIESLERFCQASAERFDLILMSQVLEHVEKQEIVPTLRLIRERLMTPGAGLAIMVPNAQSPTGCYWAYEDFTHHTLFTAGSLLFVLRAAGFRSIEFLDPLAIEGSRPPVRWLRRPLLWLYRANTHFWNRVTGSSFHRGSPQIFSFELKVIAR